jgi:outer membrane protein TolC
VQIAEEAFNQARSRSLQARAALLPDLDAYVTQSNQTRNLEAVGIVFESPIPAFRFPTLVGPFDVFDARVNLRQSIFDFAAIRRYQASRVSAESSRSERTNTNEQVTAQVARAYMSVLKADADVEAARANVELAKAVLELVESQKRAGTGTGIEITRARVQLANEEQRLLVANNERRRAELQLLRAAGMRLETRVELEDKLAFVPDEPLAWEQARDKAFVRRADLKAQTDREKAAKLTGSAVAFERLPSVSGFADYGTIGNAITSAVPTYSVGVSLRVPIFDGGRRDARRVEAQSQHRQEQARTRDLRQQVEMEVRLAWDALESAAQQVKVAAEGQKLADSELTQAQRRYKAGVATSIEVTDAQTRLERARDNYNTALFAHGIARIDLAAAQGSVGEIVR